MVPRDRSKSAEIGAQHLQSSAADFVPKAQRPLILSAFSAAFLRELRGYRLLTAEVTENNR
jgi:hypothetical protein